MSPPLLLDTHVLLWWMMDDPQLSAKVRERLAQADQGPVSAASVWEIAIKTRKGRLHGTRPYLEQHARLHLEWGFVPVAIELEDAVVAGGLSLPHGDPFDRLLMAQAQRRGADLATCDRTIRDVFERTVWE